MQDKQVITAAEQAAWHAGLDEGRAQAAPAAVAVPFELLKRAVNSLGSFVGDEGWAQTDMDTMDDLSAFLSRATLAATPAAGELAPLQVGLQEPALVVLPEEIPASNTLWMFLTKGMTQSAIAGMPERDRKVLTERAQENWAAIRAEVGATVPVVLPEPDAWREALSALVEQVDAGTTADYRALQEHRTMRSARALLAEVSAPAAQAVQMPPVTPGEFSRDIAELTGDSPQTQSDARDAQLLAFAVSEIRRDEMEHEPVLYVSKGQLGNFRDPDGPDSTAHGRYLPARVTPAGKFTTPLFAVPQAQAGALAAEITWPKARDVGRFDDMSPGDSIRVGLDNDNDVYVSVCGGGGVGSVEFCNPGGGGGGKSSRTRLALLALMVAMEADNAEDPSRDWWARSAAQAAQQGGAA